VNWEPLSRSRENQPDSVNGHRSRTDSLQSPAKAHKHKGLRDFLLPRRLSPFSPPKTKNPPETPSLHPSPAKTLSTLCPEPNWLTGQNNVGPHIFGISKKFRLSQNERLGKRGGERTKARASHRAILNLTLCLSRFSARLKNFQKIFWGVGHSLSLFAW
jgi:hypothetical protein